MLLVVGLTFNLSAIEKKKLVIATGEWEPLTTEKMESKGIASEIITKAFKEAGLEAEIKFYPWKRCEENLKTGEVDAIFPYTRNEERLKVYDFSDGIIATSTVYFYLKDNIKNIKYENLSDLNKYSIGGILGYWYENDLKKAGIKTEYVSTDEQNIKKLLAKRIDFALLTDVGGWYLIKKDFPNDLDKFASMPYDTPSNRAKIEDITSCLLVLKTNKDGAEILKKFNLGLKKIKDNGEFSKILNKYGIKQ